MFLTPLEVWRTRCFVKNLYLADTCRRLRTAPPPSLHLLWQITDLYLLRFERRVPGNTATVALSSSKQQSQTSLTTRLFPTLDFRNVKFWKLKLQINSIKQWKLRQEYYKNNAYRWINATNRQHRNALMLSARCQKCDGCKTGTYEIVLLKKLRGIRAWAIRKKATVPASAMLHLNY